MKERYYSVRIFVWACCVLFFMCACASARHAKGSAAEYSALAAEEENVTPVEREDFLSEGNKNMPVPSWPPRAWVCWLQKMQPERLKNAAVDLVVIDHSADGSLAKAYEARTISTLKYSGKTVLCYLSIGEAEDYRFYWRQKWKTHKPMFVGPENPLWKGNYKVRYWESRWWDDAIKPYIDIIIEQGFDGVFLDVVDAYWFWHENGHMNVHVTADRMLDFVQRVAEYARGKTNGKFRICVQNAEGILEAGSPEKVKRYLSTIDAISVESLLFSQNIADSAYRIEMLRRFAASGLAILNIEYQRPDMLMEYRARLAAAPFPVVGYLAEPEGGLDGLGINP